MKYTEKDIEVLKDKLENNKLSMTIGFLSLLVLIGYLAIPFMLIWGLGGMLTLKYFCTLVVSHFILNISGRVIRSFVKDAISELESYKTEGGAIKETITKSRFQQRLEKLAKERGYDIK